MIKLKAYLPNLFSGLLFIFSLLPNLGAVDIIAPQWLALSSLGFVVTVYFFFLKKKLELPKSFKRINIFYISFIGLSLVSILSSVNVDSSLITFSQYFTNYLIFLCFVYCFSSIKKHEDFFYFLIVSSLLIEITTIIIPIFNDINSNSGIIARSSSYRGLAANINIASFSIVTKLIFVAGLLFSKKPNKILKVFLWIIYAFSILALVSLSSRAAIFALILYSFFFIIKFISKKTYTTILLILVTVFSITYTNHKISNGRSIESRIESINLQDSSISDRALYFSDALNSIIKHPILGIGLGNWKLVSIKYDKENITGFVVPYHVHNDFLQIAAESGILTSICYFSLFILPVFFILKKKSLHILISSNNKTPFYILLFFGVHFIDSMLNFPIARPINQVMFNSILALVAILKWNE